MTERVLTMTALDITVFSILLLLGMALVCPLFARQERLLIPVAFSLAALVSGGVTLAGFLTLSQGLNSAATIPLGLPGLPFNIRLDPLAGFFLIVIGLLSLFVSIYSIGYVQQYLGQRPVVPLVLFYLLFLAGMLLVIIADDAYLFLVAWELMAAASYFLVMYEDEHAENRRAAFIYLLVAHVGAIGILLSFGVMAGLATGFDRFDGYTFDAMRAAHLSPGWSTAAFFLAFFGFA